MTNFNDNESMYAGTLTADEMVYAGGKVHASNTNYYLLNDYQKINYLSFWSLSPRRFYSYSDYAFFVIDDGSVNDDVGLRSNLSFRPAVTLKSGIQTFGGDGTKANAYKVS